MLDLMEIRGFGLIRDKGGRQFILTTPNGGGYAVQILPQLSVIECAFKAFQTINHLHP